MKIQTERKGIGKRLTAIIVAMSLTMSLMPAFSLHAFADGDYSGGTGTQAAPYLINTAADLKALADNVNAGTSYEGKYFKIGTYTETYTYTENGEEKQGTREKIYDINLSTDTVWTPIGTEEHPFKGHFDGNGGQINYLKLQMSTDKSRYVQAAGLFGYIDGAKLENIRIANSTVGDMNCNTYSGSGKSYYCIGNLVGFAKDSTIEYCTNYSALNVTAATGDDSGKQPMLFVGGMIGGESGSTITRLINRGAVTAGYNGSALPDIYAGGVVGGVNVISDSASKISGSENEGKITVNNAADSMKVYAGGIVGGADSISQKDKLEICQCYNRSGGSVAFVNCTGGTVICAGGILGYDDPDKNISVHDCKNDASIVNNVASNNVSDLRYAGGIVAGRGGVSNCMNTGAVTSTRQASGISYSVPTYCYATGEVTGPISGPICAETPIDTSKNYYNYFTAAANMSSDSNWQHYVAAGSQQLKSGEITWLLQGNQDPAYLHWIQVTQHIGEWPEAQPILGGGYNVYYESTGKYGDRPLDYWLKRGGNWYNKMLKERVDFGYAYSRRVQKVRFVTDEKDGGDLAADQSFESYEKSDITQFEKIAYANYQGIVSGDMPTIAQTDANNKVFQRWESVNAKNETNSAFSNNVGVSANTTVYAYGRVKFGSKDDDNIYRSVYGDGNTIEDLYNNVEYGAEPDETEEKFNYSIKDVTAEDSDDSDPKDYFTIDGETLNVLENTPVGVYTVTVTATEKEQNITLFSADMGFDPVDFTVTAEVTKKDPAYTAPEAKTRVYDGRADDVITAGATNDGTILYTLTPDDDSSWSDKVPQESELGLYNVYWKIIGDHNHKDTAPDVLSGLIIPDTSDPKNAIMITPTADWDYDGTTKNLAVVNQKPDYAEIEWSTDNSIWTNTIPTATDTGSYPVYWRTKANAYSEVQKGNFTVKVNQAKLTVTPPVGIKNKYNGQPQQLIKEAGTVAPSGKGTMKYSLNPEVNNWSDSNWSETFPTRTNAGTYKVYYRVFPSDLKNYKDDFDQANPTYVNAEITKLTKDDLGDGLKVVPANDWTYDGSPRKLVNESETKLPNDKDLSLMYSTDGGEKWDYTVPTGTDAGDYKVKWKTVGNDNIEEVSGEFTVHVLKKRPNITIEPKADWEYDGKTYTLLTVVKNDDNIRFSYSLNGGAAQNFAPAGKEAGIYKISVTSLPNSNYETYQGSFEIKCTPANASGSVTANTLTYNYGAQELVTPGVVTNGKMMYKVEGDTDYSVNIPVRTDAGTYKVWYYVKGTDANYADTDPADVDVTIKKLKPQINVNKSEGLIYNGDPRTLLTVDTDYGTVQYKVAGDSAYSTYIPKRTDAGTYTVEWKVVDAEGKANLDLSDASGTGNITIAPYQIIINPVSAPDLTYNGSDQQIIKTVTTVNNKGTVKYAVKTDGTTPADGDWKETVPTAKDAYTYTIWYKADGDAEGNMKGVAPESVTMKINKVVPTVNVAVRSVLRYTGSAQELIDQQHTKVEYAPGNGTLMYAVTQNAGDTKDTVNWKTDIPTGTNDGEYYVWYKFVGDNNTENVGAKWSVARISGNAPNVTVNGKTLTYTGAFQELVTGKIDDPNGQLKYWVTQNASDPAPAVGDSAWQDTIPEGKDKGTYYIWYYVPEDTVHGIEQVAPARVETVINEASAPDYDYTKEPSDKVKLTAEGYSFIVPWNTRLGDIELHDKTYGEYKWPDSSQNEFLNIVGTFLYDADFTAADDNYKDGKVPISITVTPKKEPTPDIEIDYIAETLTGFIPTKTYTLESYSDAAKTNKLWDGTQSDSTSYAITDGTDGTVQHMNGKKTYIVLNKSSDHTTDSDALELTIPERPEAPKTAENGGTITVHPPAFLTAQGRIEGITADMEYSVGDSNTWITGTGELTVPQNTTVYVRYKAVADTSFKSFPLEINITESQRTPVSINDEPVGINFINHTLIPEPGEKLDPNTKYTISYIDDDGKEHKFRAETDKNGELPIEEEWHEREVKIVKNGDILYTVDSEPKYKYIPPRPEPPKPQSEDSKITNVIKNDTETDEYRLETKTDYGDIENADSTKEVTPDKYVVRVKATETSFASLDAPVTVKEKTPNAQIDYIKETLNNLIADTEYIITEPDGKVITVITDNKGEIPIKDNWFGERINGENQNKTILIQKKGASEELNSNPQTRSIPPRPDKPTPDSWDSKITEVKNTMEYRLASAQDEYKTVENPTETVTVVPDDYEVRVKAVAEQSFASLPSNITVDPMPTPTGNIDFPEVKIKGLEPGEEYTVIDENGDEETVTSDDKGKIPIKEEWIGTEIQVIRNGDTPLEDSEPQTISIPKRPDPPNPSSKDSKITEVDDTMEYRPKDEADDKYKPIEDGKKESPVVDPGEYAVRIEATSTSFPSLPAYVTVEPLPTQAPTHRGSSGSSGGGGGKAVATPTPSPTSAPTPKPDDGNQSGGDIPSLNKTDHFAYISGYEDDTFRPDNIIKRGEVAAIFARLMMNTEDAYNSYTPSFPDLAEDMYFYSQVGYLEQYGIITGYEDGTFRPWESITRTEFAVIASKFAELTESEENVFTDVEDSFWGKPFILLAHKNGWVNGYEDGTFKPHSNITRAEVVSIVNRMLERYLDEEFAQENTDKMKVFIDTSKNHWAYNDILEAANGHVYIIEDSGEVWTDLT